MKTVLQNILVTAAFAVSTSLQAANFCGEIQIGQSGGDYTNSNDKGKLQLVEAFHFTPQVEKLISGQSAYIGGDLDYTLRHFPNHHRALAAIGNLSIRDKTQRPQGATLPVECYFDRAIRFKPADGVVRMVYSNYLLKINQSERAMEQLKIAVDLQPDHPNINYNLGLLYFQKKDYEQANLYAQKAYANGFPLPGLKNKLINLKKWDESKAPKAPEAEEQDKLTKGTDEKTAPSKEEPLPVPASQPAQPAPPTQPVVVPSQPVQANQPEPVTKQ